MTVTPTAAPPRAVSNTCVVIIALLSVQQLRQAQMRDLPLLFGSDRQFPVEIVGQAAFEDRQHLGRRLPRGANDENVAETGCVVPISLGEALFDVVGHIGGAGLLLGCPLLRSLLADARVSGKRLEPVLPAERGPDYVADRRHRVRVDE